MICLGAYFDDIHSYDDLNLILSKVEISPAEAKTNYIDIPGANGSLDLTEALGEVKYKMREINFTFTVHPHDRTVWEEKQTQIINALNGKYFERIILDRDSEYFYTGRCTVSEAFEEKGIKQFTVVAKVNPYKLKCFETVAQFENVSSQTVNLQNGRMPICPIIEIEAENSMNIHFGGNSWAFPAGKHFELDFRLKEGENLVTIKGEGTITFRYREGDL